jgi:general secretion pathway protein G
MTKTRNRRAFSLLELMLVLAIIGLMTAAAAWAIAGQGARAKHRITWSSMNTINAAIQQYNLNTSRYPATLQELQTGTMPYLEARNPLQDGWKQPFAYSASGLDGKPYDLRSKGPDGRIGTADDLNIWTPPQD